jgi:hypothetical protein
MWSPLSSHRRSTGCSRTRTAPIGTSARLALEHLETRYCPAGTFLLEDGTLLIRGGDEDNNIVLADHRDKTMVIVDGVAAEFMGVRQIDMVTRGGDDHVTIRSDDVGRTWSRMRIDLGGGADHLAGAWSWGENQPLDLHADFGDGNDGFEATFIPTDPEVPFASDVAVPLAPPLMLEAIMGRGNDAVVAKFNGFLPSGLRSRVDLGIGDDSFATTFIPVEQVMPGPGPAVRLPATFNVLGGAGADEIGFIIEGGHIGPDASVNLDMQGGMDADRIATTLRNLTVDGAVNVASDCGPGDDRASVFCQNNLITGSVAANTKGRAGGDEIGIIIINSRLADAGALRLDVAAGAGGDRIGIWMDIDSESRGHILAKLLGGAGEDELSFVALGFSNPNEFEALLDGGAGRDRAAVTRDVLAAALLRNVEEILLID